MMRSTSSGVELEQLGQGRQRLGRTLELLGDDVDPEIAAVDRDRLAVAVDDPAAPRRNDDQLDPVALATAADNARSRRSTASRAGRSAAPPSAAWAPPTSIIRREKVIDWWAEVKRASHLHRPSLQRSSRETIQAASGKARTAISIGGSIDGEGHARARSTRRPAIRAIRRTSSSTAAKRPFDPIIAPHGAPVDQVQREHRRRPQRDRQADRVAGEQVVDEAERRRPPGRPGSAEAAASRSASGSRSPGTSRWSRRSAAPTAARRRRPSPPE